MEGHGALQLPVPLPNLDNVSDTKLDWRVEFEKFMHACEQRRVPSHERRLSADVHTPHLPWSGNAGTTGGSRACTVVASFSTLSSTLARSPCECQTLM